MSCLECQAWKSLVEDKGQEISKLERQKGLISMTLDKQIKDVDKLHEERKQLRAKVRNLTDEKADILANYEEKFREQERVIRGFQENAYFEVCAVFIDPGSTYGKVCKTYIVRAATAEDAVDMVEYMAEEEREAGEPLYPEDCQLIASPLDLVNGIFEV